MKVELGQKAPNFEVTDIYGEKYSMESLRGKKVLLSFFRDATCPFCNLRVHELTKKYPELKEKGLVMLAFFNSPRDRIIRFVGKKSRPFPMIADSEKRIYDLFFVKTSVTGFLRGMFFRIPSMIKAMLLGYPPRIVHDIAQMPADFLIGPDSTIKGFYYSKDPADHIPLSVLETFAKKQYQNVAHSNRRSQGELETSEELY